MAVAGRAGRLLPSPQRHGSGCTRRPGPEPPRPFRPCGMQLKAIYPPELGPLMDWLEQLLATVRAAKPRAGETMVEAAVHAGCAYLKDELRKVSEKVLLMNLKRSNMFRPHAVTPRPAKRQVGRAGARGACPSSAWQTGQPPRPGQACVALAEGAVLTGPACLALAAGPAVGWRRWLPQGGPHGPAHGPADLPPVCCQRGLQLWRQMQVQARPPPLRHARPVSGHAAEAFSGSRGMPALTCARWLLAAAAACFLVSQRPTRGLLKRLS